MLSKCVTWLLSGASAARSRPTVSSSTPNPSSTSPPESRSSRSCSCGWSPKTARWSHRRDFLPVAERWGMMAEIDCWVIRQAAAMAARGVASPVQPLGRLDRPPGRARRVPGVDGEGRRGCVPARGRDHGDGDHGPAGEQRGVRRAGDRAGLRRSPRRLRHGLLRLLLPEAPAGPAAEDRHRARARRRFAARTASGWSGASWGWRASSTSRRPPRASRTRRRAC